MRVARDQISNRLAYPVLPDPRDLHVRAHPPKYIQEPAPGRVETDTPDAHLRARQSKRRRHPERRRRDVPRDRDLLGYLQPPSGLDPYPPPPPPQLLLPHPHPPRPQQTPPVGPGP